MKVAFQGEHGAYSEIAACKFFGNGKLDTLPAKMLKDVFKKVKSKEADNGIVPVENSTAGDVHETYDLLLENGLKVTGEAYLRIEHCLIGHKDAELKDVKKVYSHTQALAQCDEFLNVLGAEEFAVYDTAGAVMIIKQHGKKEEAAIASEQAAKMYGLKVLKKGIQTDNDNTTRFFIITGKKGKEKQKETPVKSGGRKTSIVFSTKHEAGALYRCLGGFAANSINMTKLVSRPLKNRQWEYAFYLDFVGDLNDEHVKKALNTLQKNSLFAKILGCYNTGDGERFSTKQPQHKL